MPITHVVAPGEHLAQIARRHGFHSVKPIWEHPDNAELKQLRKNPMVLLAGDTLIIPDLTERTESASTEQLNSFEADPGTHLLNLQLEESDATPLKNRECTIEAKGEDAILPPFDVVTDDKGRFSQTIPAGVTEGAVIVKKQEGEPANLIFRLVIGGLDPVDTVSGQQQRLNNLGYFAGFTEKDLAQLRWALEEFQFDNGIKPNGDSTHEPTQKKLLTVHGDGDG